MSPTKKIMLLGTPRIERAGQSVEYIALYNLNEHRVRVVIHSNAYAFQSWGMAERWDGAQWREVARINGEALITGQRTKLYVKADDELRVSLFAADEARLLKLAQEVLL